jgi:hypothetical protein
VIAHFGSAKNTSDLLEQREVLARFEQERPRILGLLYDAVAQGLRSMRTIRFDKLPPRINYSLWANACKAAFWPQCLLEGKYRETFISDDLGPVYIRYSGRDSR